MTDQPLFYKDELIGEFSGNILEAIAELFPHPAANQVRSYPPIFAQWRVYERITWAGAKGYRFYVSTGTSKRVLEVMVAIYGDQYRTKNYPGIFEGRPVGLPNFCLNIDYALYQRIAMIEIRDEYFVVWLPEKVEIRPPGR